MMSWRVILILAVILSSLLLTLGWCIILIIPAILGWALILSWLLDGAMWVRRKLHTAEEELDGLDQSNDLAHFPISRRSPSRPYGHGIG